MRRHVLDWDRDCFSVREPVRIEQLDFPKAAYPLVNTRTFISLETPRLILRRFRESDLVSFMAYRNDREVARYQSWEIDHAS